MKSASSQYVIRLALGAFVILVFLLQTISLAEANLGAILADNEENLNLEENKDDFVMPTADSMESDVLGYKDRVAGTDRWNDLILRVAREEHIDPIFVKCIMTLESAGEEDLVHYNKNNTYDSGLMQVNSSWHYDDQRLITDTEYAIKCGIEVIKAKVNAAVKCGNVPTVHEVAWRYNGYCQAGLVYADRFVTLYSELSKNTGDNSILLENETNNVLLLNE